MSVPGLCGRKGINRHYTSACTSAAPVGFVRAHMVTIRASACSEVKSALVKQLMADSAFVAAMRSPTALERQEASDSWSNINSTIAQMHTPACPHAPHAQALRKGWKRARGP
eukprot:3842647-Pleurochrysis_carterae.AAC.2